MKKKTKQYNNSGIKICDSIAMSVKKKNTDLRLLEGILIAIIGYISTAMVFLTMFSFKCNTASMMLSAGFFSVIYIVFSSMKNRGLAPILISMGIFGAIFWRKIDLIALGFKYVYNVIYRVSYHTEINYYKFIDRNLESEATTTFFIFGLWILAVIIYVFTIYRPHPLPHLLVCFPILEIGLYNGIKVNVFWGMLLIAFLVASFAMGIIDEGEYSGGNGGFVRKENVFFPKRQMRLKVTEKCGLFIMVIIMISTGLAVGYTRIVKYERSKELKQKRIEIRDAVNNFSTDNLTDSLTELSAALGLEFKVDTYKLGNIASMKYKNKTDLVLDIDGQISGALYLKDFTGSVYNDNQWETLADSKYKTDLFDDFDSFGFYPQDFPFRYNTAIFISDKYNIDISTKVRGNKSFAPYGTDNVGGLVYTNDTTVSSKKRNSKDFSYKFVNVKFDDVFSAINGPRNMDFDLNYVGDEEWRQKITDFCERYNILESDSNISLETGFIMSNELFLNNPQFLLTEIMQEQYEKFVYENYLRIPDTKEMKEIRDEFSVYLKNAEELETQAERLNVLQDLRKTVSDMTEYSLSPGKTPNNRDFVNYFLLENTKGYCTHYATSGVILARMAGIPARYATGYVVVGEDFNDETMNEDGTYTIKVQDNRRHAWVEVYISGYGWVPFEFTAGYTDQSIETETTTTTTTTETTVNTETETTVVTSDVTEENTERNTENRTQQPKRNTVTSAVATFGTGGSSGSNSFGNVIKNIVWTIIFISLVILFFIGRRKVILEIRKKNQNLDNQNKRVKNIYRYMEKLLKYKNIEVDKMTNTDLADFVEAKYGGIYFDVGDFAEFMTISLYAAFSGGTPEKSDVDKNKKLADKIAGKIYDKSGKLRKAYLKYILCLV